MNVSTWGCSPLWWCALLCLGHNGVVKVVQVGQTGREGVIQQAAGRSAVPARVRAQAVDVHDRAPVGGLVGPTLVAPPQWDTCLPLAQAQQANTVFRGNLPGSVHLFVA